MATSGRDDGPVRLLRAGVVLLGAGRPQWGAAMLVELAQVEGRRRRWVFALGCIRCLAFTRPASTSQRVVASGVFVAAIASLSVVAVTLVRYPGVVSGVWTWVAVGLFAAVLTAYVVAAVNAGPGLVETRLTVASAVAGAFIAVSWLGIGVNTTVGGSAAVMVALLVLGLLVGLGLGWLATARSGSGRVGLACVTLTALTAGFALFLVWTGWTVATGGRPYDPGLLRDFTSSGFADLATYAVNDSLGTAMILLLLVPVLSAASGLAGAAAARIEGSRRPI